MARDTKAEDVQFKIFLSLILENTKVEREREREKQV
jgi:hypothetical protein